MSPVPGQGKRRSIELPAMNPSQTDPPGAAAHASAPDATRETPPAAASSSPPSAEERLVALEARHAEVSDAYLRAKAEAENTRRRAEEEISKARKYAVESFAESLLPVCDSLQAALDNGTGAPDKVLEGVGATLRQLQAALERNKVVAIAPPAGTRFDPHHHQAISMVPADQDPHTVVSVLQKGYLIAERVLRPALVTVAAPKS
jgi:molecular chaperone GrpE